MRSPPCWTGRWRSWSRRRYGKRRAGDGVARWA
jgi:hypothetical protein